MVVYHELLEVELEQTFAAVKALLEDREAWNGIHVAHRPIDGETYTVLWPKALTKFDVS